VELVRLQWLLDSWQVGKCLKCEDYAIPPFAGLCITITGIPIERRDTLRALIIKCGGEYMGGMEACRTTHLVAEEPSGAKYEAATNPAWGSTIAIVHSRWVEE
ncbi:unnamed protein product, partial [Choristocarpus tenellus]